MNMNARLEAMKARVRAREHAILHHPDKPGRVVIPRHAGITIKLSVIQDALDQSALSADELRELL